MTRPPVQRPPVAAIGPRFTGYGFGAHGFIGSGCEQATNVASRASTTSPGSNDRV